MTYTSHPSCPYPGCGMGVDLNFTVYCLYIELLRAGVPGHVHDVPRVSHYLLPLALHDGTTLDRSANLQNCATNANERNTARREPPLPRVFFEPPRYTARVRSLSLLCPVLILRRHIAPHYTLY